MMASPLTELRESTCKPSPLMYFLKAGLGGIGRSPVPNSKISGVIAAGISMASLAVLMDDSGAPGLGRTTSKILKCFSCQPSQRRSVGGSGASHRNSVWFTNRQALGTMRPSAKRKPSSGVRDSTWMAGRGESSRMFLKLYAVRQVISTSTSTLISSCREAGVWTYSSKIRARGAVVLNPLRKVVASVGSRGRIVMVLV